MAGGAEIRESKCTKPPGVSGRYADALRSTAVFAVGFRPAPLARLHSGPMNAPENVTVGVVLYGPEAVDAKELEQESARASHVAQSLGAKTAFGQAIGTLVPRDTWNVILARQRLANDTPLLASVHFFEGRPTPLEVASALAVFAQAWLHRREHGKEPPADLALRDLPPGSALGTAKTLREAARKVNLIVLDADAYGDWMRAYESAWG